jgi:hypothetical protein
LSGAGIAAGEQTPEIARFSIRKRKERPEPMIRSANRIARLTMAGSVVLPTALPGLSAIRSDQPIQGWPAMEGADIATLLNQAQSLPTSDMAVGDQPYCAVNDEISSTLKHDFNEAPVDVSRRDGTELWGSDQMGTWTLVATRPDDTSCIIASGIGYDDRKAAEVYYTTAGLS